MSLLLLDDNQSPLLAQLLRELAVVFNLTRGRFSFTNLRVHTTEGLVLVKGEIIMIQITDTQQFDFDITPLDRRGNPTTLDGPPMVVSSDTLLGTVEQPDAVNLPNRWRFKATGPLGTAQVQVSGDANVDPNVVETITGTLDVVIVAGQAASFNIQPGVVSEQ